MADLRTNLLGFTMNSPIIGASGTVGYGVEYEELADFSKIGGISGIQANGINQVFIMWKSLIRTHLWKH